VINKVILTGRLTKDPEMKYVRETPLCSFNLAVDRNFKSAASGEREADFIPIKAWSAVAETCVNNLAKGRLIGITGELRTSSWEMENGQRGYRMEVVADEVTFLDQKREKTQEKAPENVQETAQGQEKKPENVQEAVRGKPRHRQKSRDRDLGFDR